MIELRMNNCVITFELFTPKTDKDIIFIGEVEIMAVSYYLIINRVTYKYFQVFTAVKLRIKNNLDLKHFSMLMFAGFELSANYLVKMVSKVLAYHFPNSY